MKFTEIDKMAIDLQKQSVHTDFYKMCLCFSLQNMFKTEEHEPFTKEQFSALNRIMYNHCEDNYTISPWEIADAIVDCCEEHGVEEFIDNYDFSNGTMLEDKLCEMC
jgi:hypothetical protein